MKEIERYIVISEERLIQLTDHVSDYIEKGYTVQGGIAVYCRGQGRYETQYFVQAMVKYKAEE